MAYGPYALNQLAAEYLRYLSAAGGDAPVPAIRRALGLDEETAGAVERCLAGRDWARVAAPDQIRLSPAGQQFAARL
jgi:hypothetical protein